MTVFQLIAASAMGGLFVLSLRNALRGRGRSGVSVLWALLWLLAGVAVVRPQLTRVLANALGIGRGADLVLYASVLTMMAGFFVVYVRIRRLRREVTLLTRELAIARARVPEPRLGHSTELSASVPLADSSQS
jgi:hypothetical protein